MSEAFALRGEPGSAKALNERQDDAMRGRDQWPLQSTDGVLFRPITNAW